MSTESVQQEFLAKAPASVGAMLLERIAESASSLAFTYPDSHDAWQKLTWAETGEQVFAVAAGLLALGVQREDRVGISSNTRIEWVLADYGVNAAAAATTAIYPNTADKDVAFILADSGARVVFVEDDAQVAKITLHTELADQVATIIVFDGTAVGDRILTWPDFLAKGRAHLALHPQCVVDAIATTGHDTLATVIYTSGTTGQPKGVELLHVSWTWLATTVDSMEFVTPDAVQYLWLPLSHVFGKALTALQLKIGFCSAVDGRIDRIVSNLAVVHPTFMCGAPRIFEKVRAAVLTGATSKGVKGRIARWAFSTGYTSIPYRLDGREMPALLKAKYAVADRLVFSKLKEKLGGNMQFMVSGAAKLSPQVQQWFYAAGIKIVEGYGLTETSAVSCVNHHSTPRFGTVGPAVPGLEISIADDGEVLFRGPSVMRGYHNNPEATAEVITDGWFHTGDIGELTDAGALRITDRKKDLIKTSGGKYVAPQKVEGAIIANIPYVSQAVAVGDGHKYIGALLVLDRDNLLRWGAKRNLGDDYAELSQRPEIRRSIERFMQRANSRLERWETVKKFAILDHELTVDEGMTTPNMKIRRAAVVAQHADIVDSLFTVDADGLDA